MPVAAYVIVTLHNILFILFGVIAFCCVAQESDHWIAPSFRTNDVGESDGASVVTSEQVRGDVDGSGSANGSAIDLRTEA